MFHYYNFTLSTGTGEWKRGSTLNEVTCLLPKTAHTITSGEVSAYSLVPTNGRAYNVALTYDEETETYDDTSALTDFYTACQTVMNDSAFKYGLPLLVADTVGVYKKYISSGTADITESDDVWISDQDLYAYPISFWTDEQGKLRGNVLIYNRRYHIGFTTEGASNLMIPKDVVNVIGAKSLSDEQSTYSLTVKTDLLPYVIGLKSSLSDDDSSIFDTVGAACNIFALMCPVNIYSNYDEESSILTEYSYFAFPVTMDEKPLDALPILDNDYFSGAYYGYSGLSSLESWYSFLTGSPRKNVPRYTIKDNYFDLGWVDESSKRQSGSDSNNTLIQWYVNYQPGTSILYLMESLYGSDEALLEAINDSSDGWVGIETDDITIMAQFLTGTSQLYMKATKIVSGDITISANVGCLQSNNLITYKRITEEDSSAADPVMFAPFNNSSIVGSGVSCVVSVEYANQSWSQSLESGNGAYTVFFIQASTAYVSQESDENFFTHEISGRTYHYATSTYAIHNNETDAKTADVYDVAMEVTTDTDYSISEWEDNWGKIIETVNSDNDDSSDDKGTGDRDGSSDDVTTSRNNLNLVDAGTTTYTTTLGNIKKINNFLNDNDAWSALTNDKAVMMESVVSVKAVAHPGSTIGGGSDTIIIGGINTEAVGKAATKQNYDYTVGSIKVSEYYGSFLDYGQYTTIKLYLPFAGLIPLDTNLVMGKTLTVTATLDIIAGSLTYHVIVDSVPIHEVVANCSYDIPLTATDYRGLITGALNLATSTLFAGGSTATANPIGLASGSVGTINGALNMMGSIHGDKTRTGSFGGAAGFNSYNVCYLMISRPTLKKPSTYESMIGKPLNASYKLSSVSGFTTITDIKLSSVPYITDSEANELRTIIAEGIYL